MNKKIALISCLVLTSCGGNGNGIGMAESPMWHKTASKEVRIEYFKDQCTDFGFKVGTTQMSQCIQNQMNQSRSDASAQMDRVSQWNQQNRIRSTNCNQFGSQINCTTY